MRNSYLFLFCIIFTSSIFGQTADTSLKMVSNYGSQNSEIRDILQFEGIDLYQVKFIGANLSDKSYRLSVKEVWDGKIVSDSSIVNSLEMPFEKHQLVNDTVLNISVLSKHVTGNMLKVQFKFPGFSIERKFMATESNDYSMRNLAEESMTTLEYGKSFYWMAYILPYKREDGSKSWCDVASEGSDIENWGEKFGIKHYLLFEMTFK